MKRIYKIAFVIFMISLLLVSCKNDNSDPSVPEGMTLCENEYLDYLFYYPSEWSVDRNDGMISVYANSEDRSNVSVTSFGLPGSVTDFAQYLENEYLTYFKANFPDMEMISATEATVDGAPAMEYVFKCNIAGVSYKFMQTVALNIDVHVITYTAQEAVFDEYVDEAARMVTELKFK